MRSTALALWAAIAGWLTLRSSADSTSAFVTCVLCGDTGASDFLLNIVLFAPLGALMLSGRRSVWWVMIVGVGVSVLIELLQLGFAGGRTVSPGDVLANGSGATIGALLVHYAHLLRSPDAAQRRGFMAAWSVLTLAVMSASWWSSRPWLLDGDWYVQRTPSRAWADDYQGALHFAGIGNTDLASDAVRDVPLVQAVRSGAQDFTVLETPGRAPQRLSYTARLVEGRTTLSMATFARRGEALVLSRNTNAAKARLSTIGVQIEDVYRELHGDSVMLRMNLVSGTVLVRSRARTDSLSLPLASPLRGWSWFLPSHRDLTPTQRLAADLLWALALLLPLLWWWRVTPPVISRASTPASDHVHR